MSALPVRASDLTFVKVNASRAYGDLSNWDGDDDPGVGQRVQVAGGSSERLEAVVVDVRSDGTIVLTVPQFAGALRVAG